MDDQPPRDTGASPTEEGTAPPTKHRWPRRVLKVLGILLVVILLFIVFLPLLITWLPTERWISSAASNAVPGDIVLTDLRVGWFGPIRIGGLELNDPVREQGRQFLRIEEFRIERGLLAMAFSRDRLGAVTVQSIEADVVRDADGAFNFAAFIPPEAAVDEEPPTVREELPAEPFVLDLEALIPAMTFPLSRLSVEVQHIDVSWRDFASSPTTHLAFEDAGFRMEWPGGTEPLTMQLAGGKATSPGKQSVPVEWEGHLENWIDLHGTTMLGESRFRTHLLLAEEEAFVLETILGDGALSIQSVLPLVPWRRLALLLPMEELPEWEGLFEFDAGLSPAADGYQNLDMRTALKGVVVSLPEPHSMTVPIPDVQFAARVQVHKETFDRRGAQAAFETSFFHVHLDEGPEEGTVRRVSFDARLETEEPLRLAAELFPDLELPQFDAPFSANGELRHDNVTLLDGTLEAQWFPRVLELANLDPFPPTFRPHTNRLDISPLAFTLKAEGATEGKILRGAFRMENGMVEFLGSGTMESAEVMEGNLDVEADLRTLSAFLADLFHMEPAAGFGGTVTGGTNVRFVSGKVDHGGRFALDSFHLETEALPGFRFEDDLALDWEGTASIEEPYPASLHLQLRDRFADVTLSGSGSMEHLDAFTLEARLALGTILEDLVQHFVPDLPAEAEGTLVLALSASEEERGDYRVRLGLHTEEDFQGWVPEFSLELLPVRAFAELGIVHAGETLSLEITNAEAGYGDLFEGGLSGTLHADARQYDFDLASRAVLHYGPLLHHLEPLLFEMAEMGLAGEGTTTFGARVSGAMTMNDDAIVYTDPIRLTASADTAIEVLEWMTADAEAALFGLNIGNEWQLSLDPNDLDSLTFEEVDEIHLAGAVYNGIVEMEDFSLRSRTRLAGMTEFALAVEDTRLGSVSFQGDPYMAAMEDIQFGLRMRGNPTSQTLIVESLLSESPGIFRVEGGGNADWPARTIALDGMAELPDLSALAWLADPNPMEDFIEELAGRFGAEVSIRTTLEESEEGALWPRELAGRFAFEYSGLTVSMPETMSLTDAEGTFLLEGTLQGARMESRNSLPIVLAAAPDVPGLRDLRFDTSLAFREDGTLNLEEFTLSSESFATTLWMRTEWRNLFTLQERFAAPEPGETTLDILLSAPWSVFAGVDHSLAPLADTPWLDESDGRIAFTGSLMNFPRSLTLLRMEPEAQAVSARMGETMSLRGLDGGIDLRQPLYHGPAPAIAADYGSGSFYLDSFSMDFGGALLEISDAKLSLWSESGRQRLRVRSSSFLGGTLDFQGEIRLRGGDPVLEGSLALTGLDFAPFYPELRGLRADRRRMNAFGTLSWRIPSNPTGTGVLEDLSLRLSLTDMGAEVLRAMLRDFNKDRGSPGIQTTLAAMRFSSPESARLDIQGGILNSTVTMTTPGGVNYTLPLFERANIVSGASTYLSPELDESLGLLRYSMILLLSGSMEPIRQILADGAQTP